ncbi:Hypothetical_protein [Hexamita inflata]|uniref:Hypothetical_protein n=1 Tax=Hexamita inflata TaxID=28002 RepID=A0AA86R829_9EUKA|nr:Hypothetical protein HINF_LOCUS60035 [Hexamita inflata]
MSHKDYYNNLSKSKKYTKTIVQQILLNKEIQEENRVYDSQFLDYCSYHYLSNFITANQTFQKWGQPVTTSILTHKAQLERKLENYNEFLSIASMSSMPNTNQIFQTLQCILENSVLHLQSSAKITVSAHPFKFIKQLQENSQRSSQYSSSDSSSSHDDLRIKSEYNPIPNQNHNEDVVLFCFYLNIVSVSEITSKLVYVYQTNYMQVTDEILQILNIIKQGLSKTRLRFVTSVCAYDSVYWLNMAKPQINSVLTRFFGNTKRPNNHPIYKLLNQCCPKALIDRFSIMKQIRDYMIKTWLIFHSDSKTKTEYRHIFNIEKLINGLPELNWERQFLQHNGKQKTEYDYIPVRMLNPQQAFILLQNDYLHQGILLLAIAPLFMDLERVQIQILNATQHIKL